MRTRTPVPTAAEIAKRLEAQRLGVVPDSPEVMCLKAELAESQRQLQSLREANLALETNPKKFTAAEMRHSLDEIFRKYGVEPAEEVVKLLTEVDEKGELRMSRDQRAKVWLELMQYRTPKLRAMEHSGKVDTNMTILVVKYSTNEVIEKRPFQLPDPEPIDVEVKRS